MCDIVWLGKFGRLKVDKLAKKNNHRMSFMLSQRAIDRLENIKQIADLTNNADVVRQSLRLYEYLIKEAIDGSQFVVRSKDGSEKPISLFLISETT